MKYNYINKDNKNLKIGIYSTYFPNLDKKFIEYQKKVFDKFNIELNQIEIFPNMLGKGFNSHGTMLTELSQKENVDYLIFFDADAIPLQSDFLNIVIDSNLLEPIGTNRNLKMKKSNSKNCSFINICFVYSYMLTISY